MKRMSSTWPDRRASSPEKCNGVQSRIAFSMDRESAESSARPPLECTKTMRGSSMTAPLRVKLKRTVTWSVSCGGRQQAAIPVAMPWTRVTSGGRASAAEGWRPEGERGDCDRGATPRCHMSLHGSSVTGSICCQIALAVAFGRDNIVCMFYASLAPAPKRPKSGAPVNGVSSF